MNQFTETSPSLESHWRSIILFGRNVASYKFALAKSLIELAQKEEVFVSLSDLAIPFSKYILEHLQKVDKQGTSSSSKFLDYCRQFNDGKLEEEELLKQTVKLGFVNVIDAFHVVNRGFWSNPRKWVIRI